MGNPLAEKIKELEEIEGDKTDIIDDIKRFCSDCPDIIDDIKRFCSDCPFKNKSECIKCIFNEWFCFGN